MEECVKIKICGITDLKEIEMLNEARADYAGFVFYEKSKRYIIPERAAKLKEGLIPSIRSVAVTVSPDREIIRQTEALGFDIIQIHGEIKLEVFEISHRPLWIAVNAGSINEAENLIRDAERLAGEKADKIEAYVFDAPSFGSGRTSDWEGGRRPDTEKKFVLAGGLDSGNVIRGIGIFAPDVVDVSSSVEGENGKDRDKVLLFVNTVRKGDGQ